MSDQGELEAPLKDDSGTTCSECQSKQVRPSRSAYPRDREKIADGASSFWRCSNCGARFLGPLAPERSRRHRSRSGSRHSKESFERTLRIARMAKRWLFPVLVILSTIVAVIYMLDRRDQTPEEIVFPDG